jgi:hypothetical protein
VGCASLEPCVIECRVPRGQSTVLGPGKTANILPVQDRVLRHLNLHVLVRPLTLPLLLRSCLTPLVRSRAGDMLCVGCNLPVRREPAATGAAPSPSPGRPQSVPDSPPRTTLDATQLASEASGERRPTEGSPASRGGTVKGTEGAAAERRDVNQRQGRPNLATAKGSEGLQARRSRTEGESQAPTQSDMAEAADSAAATLLEKMVQVRVTLKVFLGSW